MVLCLLLGALINVLVATACAYWWWQLAPPSGMPLALDDATGTSRWPWAAASDWPEVNGGNEWRTFGSRLTIWYHGVSVNPSTVHLDHEMTRKRTGWPMLALESRGGFPLAATIDAASWVREGVRVQHDGQSVILPLWPIWPGFLVNTLAYGALVAAPVLAPGVCRRAYRRRHGLCLRCAYPIGAAGVCSECGHAHRHT